MQKLTVFNHVTLDGYFVDSNGDMSWAHKDDAEWNAFVAENASGGGTLVLGRITYDLMVGFWPTPFALENMPVVAERMNNLPKVVFSRTLHRNKPALSSSLKRTTWTKQPPWRRTTPPPTTASTWAWRLRSANANRTIESDF